MAAGVLGVGLLGDDVPKKRAGDQNENELLPNKAAPRRRSARMAGVSDSCMNSDHASRKQRGGWSKTTQVDVSGRGGESVVQSLGNGVRETRARRGGRAVQRSEDTPFFGTTVHRCSEGRVRTHRDAEHNVTERHLGSSSGGSMRDVGGPVVRMNPPTRVSNKITANFIISIWIMRAGTLASKLPLLAGSGVRCSN